MAKKIAAVSACAMGLAHTFMAAEGLEEAAKALGYEIKIETQGADGLNNKLTRQDLEEANFIIHAVAVQPQEYERFDDYTVYEISLQDAIKDAESIIKQIEEMEK